MTDPKPVSSCPRCQSTRIHRSRSLNFQERSFKLIGARKRRCHECGFTFLRWGASVLMIKDLERLGRRLMHYAAVAVSLLLLLIAIRWFVLRLAEPGPSGNLPGTKDLQVFADNRDGSKFASPTRFATSVSGRPAASCAALRGFGATLQL